VGLKTLAVKLSQAKAKGAKSKEFPKISGKTMRTHTAEQDCQNS